MSAEKVNLVSIEIILVDDGSPDRSWERIVELSKQDRRIHGIQLSRNFELHVTSPFNFGVST